MAKSSEPKKAAKEKKVKTTGLSEDRIVDSDSEGEQKPAKSPAKPVEKVKKTKAKKAATPPPPPPPKKVESSDEEDSDDLDGDDESTASESGKPASNGVKRKAEDEESSSSSSEEASSSESPEEAKPVAKKVKTSKDQPKKTAPAATSPPSPPPAAAPPPSIPAATFSAPKDFSPVDVAKTHSTLSKNLQGKQIWHITAPSTLPIAEIQNVALDAIANGSTILTHKGSAYSLYEDTTTSSTMFTVLLPGDSGYQLLEQPVEKTLRLQQKIVLPALSVKQAKTETGGEAAADVWATAKVDGEGVRPQPKGMRMRYKPPGFGLGDAGLGSDDDGEDEGFKLPKTKKAKKSRRESGEGMEGVEMTGKELSKEERKKAKKAAKAAASQ